MIFAIFVIVGNVVLNPEAFIHLDDLMAEVSGFFRYAGNTYTNRISPEAALNIYRAKIDTLVFHYMGIPLALTILAGTVAIVLRRTQAMLLLLLAAIAITLELMLQTSNRFVVSYWTTILPFFFVMASIGLISFVEIGQRQYRVVGYAVLAISGFIVFNEACMVNTPCSQR